MHPITEEKESEDVLVTGSWLQAVHLQLHRKVLNSIWTETMVLDGLDAPLSEAELPQSNPIEHMEWLGCLASKKSCHMEES